MENLIQGLFVAAIGGLTYVAYKHPDGYSRMYWPLMGAVILSMTGILIWELGISAGLGALLPLLQDGKAEDALRATNAIKILSGWHFAAYFVLIVYLMFLSALPHILGNNKNPNKKNNKESD